MKRFLKIPNDMLPKHLDATDGLAAAYCHYLQSNRPKQEKQYKNGKEYVGKNPDKVTNKKVEKHP